MLFLFATCETHQCVKTGESLRVENPESLYDGFNRAFQSSHSGLSWAQLLRPEAEARSSKEPQLLHCLARRRVICLHFRIHS